jgi:hypothetical protein
VEPRQIDKSCTKYTREPGPYALHDSRDRRETCARHLRGRSDRNVRQTLAAGPWAFENNRPASNRIEENANA